MVSEASKKKAAQKKAAAAAKRGGKAAVASSSSSSAAAAADKAANGVAALKLSDRTCTGVLASHPLSRDIHVSTPFPIEPSSSCCFVIRGVNLLRSRRT
jgi:ATP-binding cassette subfamily F protein 2